MLYKIINNIVSLPSSPIIRLESSHNDLHDFNNQRIYLPYCRTDTYKYSFSPQAIKLRNSLPLQITDSPSFPT